MQAQHTVPARGLGARCLRTRHAFLPVLLLSLAPLLSLQVTPALAQGTTYYVATTGSDSSGTGVLTSPWKTINFGISKLKPGDTLFVRAGTYLEQVSAAVSGTATAPILVQGYQGETVTVDSGPKDSASRPLFQNIGNNDWELVNASIGEYRSKVTVSSGTYHGYVLNIPGYENGRVSLVPYKSAADFRATTDQYVDGATPFYVGPGIFFDSSDNRLHIRLSKTNDMVAAERRYRQVFPDDGDSNPLNDNVNPARYAISLSQRSSTLTVRGSYLTFKNLSFNQAGARTIEIAAGAHHVTFDGITAWMGTRSVSAESGTIHDITLVNSRLLGDWPYWIFWSDVQDSPSPANNLGGTSVDLRGGTYNWTIAYNLIRGSGLDLISTNDNETNIFIHHNRLENCLDDALEIEGTKDIGHIEIYENFIVNCLTAVAPGQDTLAMTGPVYVYRNVMVFLRDQPINRKAGINTWNGFGGRRFGRHEMFKHSGSYVTKNIHYYHNTMVLDRSKDNERGLRSIVAHPANTRVADNLMVVVNGAVNGEYRSESGFVMNGNLYWKMNTVDTKKLLYGYDTVPAFAAATGYETNGIGGTAKRGTDPKFSRFAPQFEDKTKIEWYPVASSEVWKMSDFILAAGSPAIGAGIAIPPLPTGPLPDTKTSRDIGAFPAGTSASEYDIFPFVPDAAPAPTTLPAAPSELAASAPLASQVQLTWKDNSSNETGFKIERCQGSGCTSFTPIGTAGPNATSYQDGSVSAGTSYVFRVRASNSAGDSAPSNTAAVTTPAVATAPTAPSNLQAAALSETQVQLTWSDNSSNEDGFRVERCQGSGCTSFQQVVQTGPGATSLQDGGLTAGTSYTYRVRSYNAAGASDPSNTTSITTPPVPAAPAAPGGLSASATSPTQATLSWTDNATNEDGVQVERCRGTGCSDFVQVGTTGANATSYLDGGLKPDNAYAYRVRAYNSVGNSAYSNVASVMTPSKPTGQGKQAFPGAQGHGAMSAGGRGGKVLLVRNLRDSGPGSLRAALEASGPRVVVFRLGGTIVLRSPIEIRNSFLTVAGQTAPGGGITIRGGGSPLLQIRDGAHDIVLRYLRLRNGPGGPKGAGTDNLTILEGHDIILDHVSLSWASDENLSLYVHSASAGTGIHNVTIQRSLLSEGLAGHSAGLLVGGDTDTTDPANPIEGWRQIDHISLHHNLFAHNSSSSPRVTSGGAEVVNNVVFNWENQIGSTTRGSVVDHVANFFKAGPMSDLTRLLLHDEVNPDRPDEVYSDPSLFISSNLVDPIYPNPEDDNWALYRANYTWEPLPNGFRRFVPLSEAAVPIAVQSAAESYSAVLADVGVNARLDCRGRWVPNADAVDLRILQDVRDGTGPAKPVARPLDVGGWPKLAAGLPCEDTDHDGMPNVWERAYGLLPAYDGDAAEDADGDGYTNLEEYLNGTNPLVPD